MVDPWDAFGKDDDDEGDTDSAEKNSSSYKPNASITNQHDAAVAVSTALVHRWLRQGDTVSLRHRRILLIISRSNEENISDPKATECFAGVSENYWKNILSTKSFKDVTTNTIEEIQNETNQSNDIRLYDAIIWLIPSPLQILTARGSFLRNNEAMLIPGGYLILFDDFMQSTSRKTFSDTVWDFESSDIVSSNKDSTEHWTLLSKWSCVIDGMSCKWLSTKHSTIDEHRLLSSATLSLSVYERENGYLNSTLLNKAAGSIRQHGYCIISGLLHSERKTCLAYGEAAIADIYAASKLLKQEGIDLFEPSLSIQEPGIYRELSMREDCRMDIRHGPALDAIRGPSGGVSITFKATDEGDSSAFLRGNNKILSIVRHAMNPVTATDRSKGNYGRYNFDGSGPDGSDRDLVCGPVGAIVNLPGSGDQAIHADTPHLFEHVIDPSPLPPHYINVFTLGCPAMDNVGQTAFIHGSHRLEFVSSHVRDASTDSDSRDPFLPSLWDHLVRPRLHLGDVVIFDCRILHFGLSNRHSKAARPMLYSNMTLHWFNDPKNWDEQASIFQKKLKEENVQSEHNSCT